MTSILTIHTISGVEAARMEAAAIEMKTAKEAADAVGAADVAHPTMRIGVGEGVIASITMLGAIAFTPGIWVTAAGAPSGAVFGLPTTVVATKTVGVVIVFTLMVTT